MCFLLSLDIMAKAGSTWFTMRSLKYHRLHPEYIHQRIEKLGRMYNLRILLLMCDVVRFADTRIARYANEDALVE